ncbi:MAG: glycosyltransferase family 2 protein, partial [Bacteroidia bacterium]|nr:glycosyltransferase family 2 protein [Bacteroidia bacterium]
DSLDVFRDTHPAVMLPRVDALNWKFSFDPSQIKLSFKDKLLLFIEKTTGWKVGEYRNYTAI